MENNRDRAGGWQHAKITGHINEEVLSEQLMHDELLQKRFLSQINKNQNTIIANKFGGTHESTIEGIVGGRTKSKADIKIKLDDNSIIKISLKKSEAGQVYLISVANFINGMEKQFKIKIPNDVKRAIGLFWGTEKDTLEIIKKYSPNSPYELRKVRLTAETLKKYNSNLAMEMIKWFDENIQNIFNFCFVSGLAKYRNDWAEVLWYKNGLGENSIDEVYLLNNFIFDKGLYKCEFGDKNGGTTIQLPFGFVQWHNPGNKQTFGSMQFHHKLDSIKKMKYDRE